MHVAFTGYLVALYVVFDGHETQFAPQPSTSMLIANKVIKTAFMHACSLKGHLVYVKAGQTLIFDVCLPGWSAIGQPQGGCKTSLAARCVSHAIVLEA